MIRFVIPAAVLASLAACSSPSDATPTAEAPPAADKAKPAAARKPGAAGKAQPQEKEAAKDWSPSTGKEMPTAKVETDPAVHRAALVKGLKDAQAAKDDDACDHAIDQMLPAVVALKIAPTGDGKPVFEALARCAREVKRYKVLESVARMAPDVVRSGDLALALYGQERYPEAAKELKGRLAKAPKDPQLLVVASRLACKLKDFKTCLAAADKALAETKTKADADSARVSAQANVTRWHATTMLGDYRAARASVQALPNEKVRDKLMQLLVPAEQAKLAVDVRSIGQLPLGTYHLAGTVNQSLTELTLGNGSKKDRQLRVSIEIPGVTTPMVKRVVLLARKTTSFSVTPPLLAGFATDSITSPRRVQLDVKVSEGHDVVFEQSQQLELMPRDYLPTYEKIGEDTKRPVLHNFGAWVTPNDPAVESLLTAAKARLEGRQQFSGPQSASIPQVKAIFDELKARGVSYVMDPVINSDRFLGQRTRLPSQVIASTNAQCLEGTLLFASALEALGLEATIVVVPGHAFVGWRSSPSDKGAPERLFIETTMVKTASFEDAVKVAVRRVETETKSGHFKKGLSRFLEIKDLRAKGITPQSTGATR